MKRETRYSNHLYILTVWQRAILDLNDVMPQRYLLCTRYYAIYNNIMNLIHCYVQGIERNSIVYFWFIVSIRNRQFICMVVTM